jgi:hypothetical protein
MDKKKLKFTLVFEGKSQLIHYKIKQYPDLRDLILSKININSFGTCNGVGRCTTCLVGVFDDYEINRNNRDFSCQIMIDEQLENKIITIIGDSLRNL